jgi:hypothetical protein
MTCVTDTETVVGRIARATSVLRVRREAAARAERLGGKPDELLERFRCVPAQLRDLADELEKQLA